MPGVRVTRTGEIRHCQGTVLADWAAGTIRGTSVIELAAGGLIRSVASLAKQP